MSNLNVSTSHGITGSQSVEVKASPSMEQASAYLSLPEVSSRSHSVDVKSDLRSPQELLLKLRDQADVVGGPTAEKRLVDGSTLVLLGELRPLEERLRQQQDTNNPKWQELETKLIYLRQGISTQLSRILNEYEQGNEPKAELLKDVAKELESLRKESRLIEESSRGERESTQMEKGFDRDKILTSLGYDVASLNEDEKLELEFKLALGREEVGIELEKAQAVLSEAEEKRQREIEYLTKETGETEGHFFGFLYGEYDLGNEGMKLNLQRLTKAHSEVMQAQQALASVQAEADKLDIALSTFQAERSWNEGRYEEAHRTNLKVLESSQREMVLGESKNPVLAEAVACSYRVLAEEGRLSEREKVLYSNEEGGRELFKSTIDHHREATKGEVGLDLDARDQVIKRSSWMVEEESKVSDKFKDITFYYQGRPQKELNGLEFVALRSSSGERYNLALTPQAKVALDNIPEGALPVFLKPVKSMQSNYAGGRQRSAVLANPPSTFRVEDYQIGYSIDGKFYQTGGAEIDPSKHEHGDWLKSQVRTASSFKVSEFSLGSNIELRRYNQETKKLERYRDKLHTIETESGDKIEGVKLSPEALALIKKKAPEGYTLVLKNKPESITLSALDGETVAIGRGVRTSPSRRVLGEVPELGAEDFEYAKVSEDKLERVAIDQTPISESNLTGLRQLDQTATRDIQRALANDEDVKWLRSGALSTNRTLTNLQGFLNANQEGSSREAFIEFARSEAKPLEEFLTSGDTKERIERLEGKLSELKKLSKGVAGSEYEREILDQIKALESFMSVVKDPRTLEVVKTIGDASKFGEDSWNRWASTELPIIAGSVAGAVAASAVVVASAGTLAPVVVPLWVTAVAGAVGGVIGGELAQEGLHFYETSYGGASRGEYTWSRRSLLAQVGDKTFNNETGKYEEITLGNVSLEYGKQVATNFVFSYGSMLGSQALAAKFTEALTKSKVVEKVMENSTTGKLLARYLGSKTASNMSQAERLTIEKAFKEAGRQIASELPDEFSDELLEDWTVKLIDKVGQNLSKSGVNFGQDHLAGLIVGTVKGTRVSSRSFAYDNSNISSGKQAEGLTELINQARESGYVVTNLGGGHYTFADTVNGERYTVRPKTDEDTAVFSAPQIDMMLQMQRPEAVVSAQAEGEEIQELVLPKVDLVSVREEFEFKETGRVFTTHDNVQVPTQYLVIAGREYEGYLRNNEKVFYLVNESEIPDLYADILKTREQIDENGSYDVNSFIDKETGLIFTAMPRPNETPAETEDRVKNSTHENQHRSDLVAGRELDEKRAYERASKYSNDPTSAIYDESRYQGVENLSLAASRRNEGLYSPNERQRLSVESLEKQFDELLKNGRHLEAGPWIPYFQNLFRRSQIRSDDMVAKLQLAHGREIFVHYYGENDSRVVEVQANAAKRILTNLYTRVDTELAQSHWEKVTLKRELENLKFYQIGKWAEVTTKLEKIGGDIERLETLRTSVSMLIDPSKDFIAFGKSEIERHGKIARIGSEKTQSNGLVEKILADNPTYNNIDDYWKAQHTESYGRLKGGEYNEVSQFVIDYGARGKDRIEVNRMDGFNIRSPSESGYRRQGFLIGKKDRYSLNVNLSKALIDQLDEFALRNGIDYKVPSTSEHAATRTDVVTLYAKVPLTKEAEIELAKIAREHARKDGSLDGEPVDENGVEVSANIKRGKDFTAYEIDILVANAQKIDPSLAAYIKNQSLKSGRGILSPGTYHAFENIIREHRAKYIEGKVANNVTTTFKPWLLEMKVGESKVIGRNDLKYFASPPPGDVSSQHVIITRNRDNGDQPSFTLEDRSLNGTTIKLPNGVERNLSNGQRIILDAGTRVLLYRHELPLVEKGFRNVPSSFERQRNLAQLVSPAPESGVKDWKEGRARGGESRQLKDAKINYFPSREALETEFVRQERQAAERNGEQFNESESKKRAQETYGFFSRLDNQIYVLTPETLHQRGKGEKGPIRETRILQAMAVIHELTQKRLEDASRALNAQQELDQEIAVWKECAVYLKSRGYEFQFTESGWKIVENKPEDAANKRVSDLKAKGRRITLTLAEENNIQKGVERLYAENGSEIDRTKIPSRALSQMRGESDSSSVDENAVNPEMETIAGSDILAKNLWKLENGASLTDNEILDLLIDIDQDPLKYDAKAKGLLYEALKREGYDDIESLCSNISMEVLSEAREDYYTDLFKQFRTSSNNLTHVERMRLYERLEEFGLDGILSPDKFNLLVESKNLIERIGLFNFDPTSFSPAEVADMLTKLEKSGEGHLLKDREGVLGLVDESVRQIFDNYSNGTVLYDHAELVEVAKLAELRAGFRLYEQAREEIVSVDKLVDLLSKGQRISSDELAKVIAYSKKLKTNGELLQRIGPLHPQYLDIQKGVQENLVETRVLEPKIAKSVTSQSFNPISDRVLAGILVDRSDTIAEATYEIGTRDKLLQGLYLSDDEILGLIDSVNTGKGVLTNQEMSILYSTLIDRDLLFLATEEKTLSLSALEQANLKYCYSLLARLNENPSALNLVEKARLLGQLENLNLTVSDQQREILSAGKNVLEMVGRFNFKPDLLTSRQATEMYMELKRSSELYLISDPTILKAFVNAEVLDVLSRYSDKEGADVHLWLHRIAELAVNENFDLETKLWNEVDQIIDCGEILDRFVTGDKIDQIEMDKLVSYSRTLTSFNELLNLMGEVNPHYNEFKSVLENQSKDPVDVVQTQPLEVVDVPAKNYTWTSKDDLVKDQVYYSPLSGWFRFVRRIGTEKIEVNRINGDPRYGDFYSHTEERSTSIFIVQDNQFFAQKKHASDLIVDYLAERGITLDKLGLWFAIGELHNQIAGDPKVKTNLNAIAKYEEIFNTIGNGERLSQFVERVAEQMNKGPIQEADLVLATKLVLAISENTGVDFVKVGVARQGAGNAKGNWQSFSNGVDNPALFSAFGSSASLRMDRIGSTIDDVVRRDLWDLGVNVLGSAKELGLSNHAPIILGAFYPSGGKKVTELRAGDRNTQLILQSKDSPNKVTVQELLELHKVKLDAVISELKARKPGNKVIVVGVPGSGEGVSASQLMARELALRYNLTSDNNMIYRMSEIERGDRRLDSRTVSVKSQKKTASLTDRLRNIGLAYDVRSDKEKSLENVTILLVDDVYTSGATLEIIRERLQPADVQILAFGGTTRGK